jgi:hypothetical protein
MDSSPLSAPKAGVLGAISPNVTLGDNLQRADARPLPGTEQGARRALGGVGVGGEPGHHTLVGATLTGHRYRLHAPPTTRLAWPVLEHCHWLVS